MVYPIVTELPPGQRRRDRVGFVSGCLGESRPPHPSPPPPMAGEQAQGFVDSFLITRYGHTLEDAPSGRVLN